MKKFKKIFFPCLIILLLVLVTLLIKRKDLVSNNDIRFGVVADNGVHLVSLSFQRRMVNVLTVKGDVELWIPGGMGWYRSDSIKKLLTIENKKQMAKDILFYNFGFAPEKVVFLDNADGWNNSSFLIKNIGILNWFNYRINNDKLITKEESVKRNLEEESVMLSEVLMRDFADSRILEEDTKISIINVSNQNGLANFVAQRMEWAGFSVVSTENGTQKIENCLILSEPKSVETHILKVLKNYFDCQIKQDDNLNENEMELYFGDSFAQVVKYSSYVRTF